MTSFDFLHDSAPDVITRLRGWRLPRRFHGAALAASTLLVVAAAAAGLESSRIAQAGAQELAQSRRLAQSRARLEAAKLSWQSFQGLIATDRALRRIRSSGVSAAASLARLGNLVPRGVWLDAIEPSQGSVSIRGEAVDLDAARRMLANLVGSDDFSRAQLVEVSRRTQSVSSSTVAFEMHVRVEP